LLSENSYLLEGLPSADETKMHAKTKIQNAPTFTGNGSQTKLKQDTPCNKNLYLPIV